MKPCATCKYFWNGYQGPVCCFYEKMIREFDPYSGQTETYIKGRFYAKWMRSDEGDCGPDRKLYKQSWTSKVSPYFNWFVIFSVIGISLLYIFR